MQFVCIDVNRNVFLILPLEAPKTTIFKQSTYWLLIFFFFVSNDNVKGVARRDEPIENYHLGSFTSFTELV